MNRLTIRARLTIVYSGLLLLAGILLLGVTYALVAHRLNAGEASYTEVTEVAPESAAAGRPVNHRSIRGEATDDALHALLVQGGIALLGVSGLAVMSGWLIAGRLLHPLQLVTETARRIAHAPAADRGLHERIAWSGPKDELTELANTFDLMLERLDHSFDAQRRFIANASHELRTPLTLNRALLEVAVHRGAASAEVRQLGGTLLDINLRHERLIDGLLLLARSERDLDHRSYVDLADVVEHVVGQLPGGSVTVHAEAGEAPTTGNPVLLERLVQNLVDNGVRHNIETGGWVRVSSGTGPDGTATVEVSNTGPVVPPYEVEGLFEPFRRLGTDRLHSPAPGAGLGLSIVRAVARAHGGDVAAVPRPGGGLTVTVTLPASSP